MTPLRALWTIRPDEWAGKTSFVLGCGPSASDHLAVLEGLRVVAVNSSWRLLPRAPILFYADARWWSKFRPLPMQFRGKTVTCISEPQNPKKWPHDPRVLVLKKRPPPRFVDDDHSVTMHRTSVAGAVQLCYKMGSRRIVLLGVDGRVVDGKRHAHPDRYPWELKVDTFPTQREELRELLRECRARGVELLCGTPGSSFVDIPQTDAAAAIASAHEEG